MTPRHATLQLCSPGDHAITCSFTPSLGVLLLCWCVCGAQLEERIREHLQGTGQEAALRGLGAGSGANWLSGFGRVLDRGVNMLIGDAPPVESSQGGRSSSGSAPRPPRPPGGQNQSQNPTQQQQTAVSTVTYRARWIESPSSPSSPQASVSSDCKGETRATDGLHSGFGGVQTQMQPQMQHNNMNMRNSQSSPNLSIDSPMAQPQQQETSFTPPPKSRANSDGFSAPKSGDKPAGAFSPDPPYASLPLGNPKSVWDGDEATKGEPSPLAR